MQRMNESLKLMVGAARIGTSEEEANSSEHAIELHASNLAHAADELLSLIHDLRVQNARNDLVAIDSEISEDIRKERDLRRSRDAKRAAALAVDDSELPFVGRAAQGGVDVSST